MRQRGPRERRKRQESGANAFIVSAIAAIALGAAGPLGTARLPAAPGFAVDELSSSPKLTYTRVLKGSSPEYLAISVDSNGSGTYEGRKIDEPSSPRSLKLSPQTTGRLFELARVLDDFRTGDLESHKKVANLGLKTFTYEESGKRSQAQFNYSLRREAQELTELFEKIAAVEQHIATLEYAVKYDHLGLPRELLQIQIDLDNKALADPQLMVPTLDQIARNPRFLHLAQVRAQNILERLQNSN